MTQHAEKCPICEGKTTMPGSFYEDGATDKRVECRSCTGKGYIVLPEQTAIEIKSDPVHVVPSPYPVPYPYVPPINPPWRWQNLIVWYSTDTKTTAAPPRVAGQLWQ